MTGVPRTTGAAFAVGLGVAVAVALLIWLERLASTLVATAAAEDVADPMSDSIDDSSEVFVLRALAAAEVRDCASDISEERSSEPDVDCAYVNGVVDRVRVRVRRMEESEKCIFEFWKSLVWWWR